MSFTTDQSHPSLLQCLASLREGAGYKFVLLRESALDASCIDQGDIDLLGTGAAVRELIAHVNRLCRQGLCNFRVNTAGADKTRLTLFSRDLRHRVEFDLWTELWQLDGGRARLRYDDVKRLVASDPSPLARLPLELEACVYLEHLVAKNKDLCSPGVVARLAHYHDACAGVSELRGELAGIRKTGRIDEPVRQLSARTIRRLIGPLQRGGRMSQFFRRLSRWRARRHDARRTTAVAFVGCDGVGKTSVGEALAARRNAGLGLEFVLGKQFYRRSVLFRVVYKFNRHFLHRAKERIDEWLHCPAYATAWLTLRRTLRRRGRGDEGVLLIDRSPADFLYVRRKSDRPRFGRLASLAALLWQPLPVVHFIAPYGVLASRKREVTVAGQARYDEDMLNFFCDRPGTEYLVFGNDGSVADATDSLVRYLHELYPARVALPLASTPAEDDRHHMTTGPARAEPALAT